MDNTFRFLMYRSAERNISVNAVLHDETIWLTQKAMAGLFDCTPDNISLHLKISLRTANWMKIQLPRISR